MFPYFPRLDYTIQDPNIPNTLSFSFFPKYINMQCLHEDQMVIFGGEAWYLELDCPCHQAHKISKKKLGHILQFYRISNICANIPK